MDVPSLSRAFGSDGFPSAAHRLGCGILGALDDDPLLWSLLVLEGFTLPCCDVLSHCVNVFEDVEVLWCHLFDAAGFDETLVSCFFLLAGMGSQRCIIGCNCSPLRWELPPAADA
ncbi:hypothetical protein Nepgr_018751 [Nepenthes gracilis]|uniref:Uncharacterized protein n=1 Tax=Nepenthes gracilis TaxID=150966 RepID=A0AAD3SS24_NEPGR|nr:hypothetical protein Nepgr_018751 [Nepenthes gracilis]